MTQTKQTPARLLCTEIPTESLIFIQKIGRGGFGEVWRGTWHNTTVAIKKLLDQGLKKSAIEQMKDEVALHETLRFPFIVPLFGACTHNPYCIIMEFAPLGNLFSLLYNTDRELPLPLRTGMLFDVSRGMAYLHSQDVLHRDLKSLNLLIFTNLTIKICDFGLSRIKANSSLAGNQRVGTASWTAPEILQDLDTQRKEYTTQCDVYSFAMIMYELLCRTIPFEGKNDATIKALVLRGSRPKIPENAVLNNDLQQLMQQCWAISPQKRPSFDIISENLTRVLESFGGDPREQNSDKPEESKNNAPNKEQIQKVIHEVLQEREEKVIEKEAWIEAEYEKLKQAKLNAWVEAEMKALAEKQLKDELENKLEQDKQAIARFQHDPDNYKWEGFQDILRWEKVVIENNRVIELDLSEMSLFGAMTDFRDALEQLRVLNCQKNQLTGHIPDSISCLTTLEYLSLRSNKISGSIPISLTNLQNLKELYLYQNQISGSLPVSIGNMVELINLYIHRNKIIGPIPTSIGNLRSLLILSAWGNQLVGTIPSSIGKLQNLLRLELNGNQLEGPIPTEICQLSGLQYLYLNQNRLTGPIPSNLHDMSSLKFLNLASNYLTGSLPFRIEQMTSLVCLDLNRNRLNGRLPSQLSNLTNLRDLLISNNSFSGQIPESITNLSSLQSLHLQNNIFSSVPQTKANIQNKLPHILLRI